MTILEAIVLGVVQGLTEFLPISSTAHLRIVPAVLGWDDPGAAYSAVIQCGTLAAVFVAMRRDVGRLLGGLVAGLRSGRPLADPDARLAIMIAVGTLPIVVVGFAARHLIRGEARRLEVVIGALVAATALMAVAEIVAARRARHGAGGRDGLEGVRFGDGLVMGLAQVLALVPGTSRSGVTIASGMLSGLDRATAARLSFLLSLPAVAAAGLLEAWQQRREIFGTPADSAAAVAGTLAAAVVGYAAIRWLLRILTSRTLWPFIAYRLAIAGLLVWWLSAAVALAGASPPPIACDDTTFLRRATLDLAGRQPSPAELEAFLADGSADKRAATVERLLDDPGWATTWARYFRDVILFRRTDDRALGMAKPLEAFLVSRLREGDGWDEIAREMITATGTPSEHGETAIIMAQMGETSDIAAEVSRVFLGVQIQCAQCHDHFTDRWKREQFHHFAAFFPRIAIARGPGEGVDRFRVVSYDAEPRRAKGKKPDNPRRGDLEHEMPDKDDPSKPGTVMRPTFFLSTASLPLGATDQERRRTAAREITATDNPWFARAIVNRLWTELVGEGFYPGIDDLGPDREPRDAETLDRLCRDFVSGGHDLRGLLRTIMATPAYQAESRSRGTADRDPATSCCPQRLRADQLFAQILAALDAEEGAIGAGAARKGGKRPQAGGPRAAFTQVFGYDPSLPREEILGSIPQALLLMNSQPLARAIDGDRRRTGLGKLLAEHPDDRAAIDAIYVRVLARHPAPDELQACLDHVAATGDREEGCEDVFWALLNSAEFIHRR